jgi:hypothetical protein
MALGVLLLAALLVACGQRSGPGGGRALDYALLVDRLRAARATVAEVGTATDAYGLHGVGRTILVDGARVAVYEYGDAGGAEADVAHISADGTMFSWPGKATIVDFVDPPHWYRSGRIVVLYVGTDPALQALLERQLGAPFAGQDRF